MTNQEILANIDRPSTLDCVWAATRPDDLSDGEFDAIWVEVQRACDQPPTLKFDPTRPSSGRRRLIVLVSLGLAQAAAVMAAFILTRPEIVPIPALVQTALKVNDLKIDVDELVVVLIVGTHVDTLRTQSDPGPTLAFVDVPTINPNDQLNHWEALATND